VHKHPGAPLLGAFSVALGLLSARPVAAQTGLMSQQSAEFWSHGGNIAYLALGVGLPLLRDGERKNEYALRTADALATSALLAEVLKPIFKERRPDGSTDSYSFPSGHATAAFSVAAMESHFHPKEWPLWYLGAALIAQSRVELNRHYPRDVIAGGALGVGTAAWELSQPRGLLIAPFVRKDADGTWSLGFRGSF
jgi:membrane-associated phospholipid phosphatase